MAQNFLCKLVSHVGIWEIQQHFLVIDQENFQGCLLSQEVASLNLFDLAETDDFLVLLGFGNLQLEEENIALLLLLICNIHLKEEDQLIIGHAHEALIVIERLEDIAWTLYDDFASRDAI